MENCKNRCLINCSSIKSVPRRLNLVALKGSWSLQQPNIEQNRLNKGAILKAIIGWGPKIWNG